MRQAKPWSVPNFCTVRLADRLGVDLEAAAWRKIELNARKYPADQVRGSARKAKTP